MPVLSLPKGQLGALTCLAAESKTPLPWQIAQPSNEATLFRL